jgi:hypothetical protein
VFSLNGERCTAGSRILAERTIYPDLVTRLATRAERIRVGDPSDPATEIGALVHPEHYARVLSYVQAGLDEGARLVAGGSRPRTQPAGNYLAATVFADVEPSMRIFREEIFGPVVCVTGPGPRAPPGGRGRGRDDLDQLAQRAGPADPVRRGQGQRARPRGRRAQPGLLH